MNLRASHGAFAYTRVCCRNQGPAGERGNVTNKTPVIFTWSVRAPGVNETCIVELRCDDALRHGVPLPKEWEGKIAWRSGTPAVDEYAATAVQRARVELGLGDVKLDCRLAPFLRSLTRAREIAQPAVHPALRAPVPRGTPGTEPFRCRGGACLCTPGQLALTA